MEMNQTVVDPSAALKKEDETSILMLIWKGPSLDNRENAWAMIEKLNTTDAPQITDCGPNPLDLRTEYEGRLARPHSILVGSHLYCISGDTEDRESGDLVLTNKVFRFDISQPSVGWKLFISLPFYSRDIQTVVSGDLIYMFPCPYHRYRRAGDRNPTYSAKKWAYILDTKEGRGRDIPSPELESDLELEGCPSVIACASIDNVVMVYLTKYDEDGKLGGVSWFHDPVENSWKTYSELFGIESPQAVVPPISRMNWPSVCASTFSNGKLYILRVGCADVWGDDELWPQPLLSVYDIRKGELLFADLKFAGPYNSIGTSSINYLFAVGDCKLCWLLFFPGMEYLCYTIISISDGPNPILVEKSGDFPDFQVSYLASSCLACDSSCVDQLKKIFTTGKVHGGKALS